MYYITVETPSGQTQTYRTLRLNQALKCIALARRHKCIASMGMTCDDAARALLERKSRPSP